MTKKEINELQYRIIGAAINVHRELGPGLLESVYHKCLKYELRLQGIRFRSEMLVNVPYRGINIDTELRCDLLVEDKIAVELKSVELLAPVHSAQLLTYMRLLEKPKGILINFNSANLYQSGQRVLVNEFFKALPDG